MGYLLPILAAAATLEFVRQWWFATPERSHEPPRANRPDPRPSPTPERSHEPPRTNRTYSEPSPTPGRTNRPDPKPSPTPERPHEPPRTNKPYSVPSQTPGRSHEPPRTNKPDPKPSPTPERSHEPPRTKSPYSEPSPTPGRTSKPDPKPSPTPERSHEPPRTNSPYSEPSPTLGRSHEPLRTNGSDSKPSPTPGRSHDPPRTNKPDPTSSSSSRPSGRTQDKVPHVLTQPLTASTISAYVAALHNTEDSYIEEIHVAGRTNDHKNPRKVYSVPDDLKDLIKKGKIPPVLTKPITASTYSAYFAALLHEEDYYIEKWNGFLMSEVTLQLHEELSRDGNTKKRYVKFEIDSIPEKRPFLLSRDFVIIKPSGKSVQPFEGSLSRVMKKIWVLAEFKDDFYSQFLSQRKYDVSFSFNRVPLKRTHEAIAAAASDPSFRTFLFPDPTSQISFSNPTADRFLGQDQTSTIISRIFSLKSPPPYLVEGPLSVTVNNMMVSRTGVVLVEAIVQLYRASPNHRILVVAPRNNTCDTLMERLLLEIPGSETFRANAAFRDRDEVPEGIFFACLYEGERFKCPPLAELQKYRVITSTYISSFKIRTAGINAGHFSHIFLVDASSATEPELMVALTNLANEKTAVVVTGSLMDHPAWVRSDIARKMGLSVSYFERLMNSRPYSDRNPGFVAHLED